MTDSNPTDIFNDFRSGKIDKSSAIDKLFSILKSSEDDKVKIHVLELIVSNFLTEGNEALRWVIQNEKSPVCLFELYEYLEANGTEKAKNLVSFMEEELGKEFLVYFDLMDPREGVALKLLELDTGTEVTTSSGASQHYVDFKTRNGHIEALSVCQVVVSNTKFLKFLPRLRILSFYSQCISKIEGLEYLSELEKLELTDNGLIEIQGLENLHNLKDLDLSYNRFSEINGLEYLTKLEKLDLSYNQLEEINGLENLKNLEELHLIENNISKIKGIKKLTNLKVLDLPDTKFD